MLPMMRPRELRTETFYADLPALPEYTQMIDPRYYRDLPGDWLVVMTDVKGSTDAIARGLYKEVNMIGVSTIVAVRNARPGAEFPFVFGGDGATMAVPATNPELTRGALSLVRDLARTRFGLDLRVALIPVEVLKARGAELKCAKLRLSENQTLALVRGDGWRLAEDFLKDPGEPYGLPADAPLIGDVRGLECRWNPLPARRGEMLALIVRSRLSGEPSERVLREILLETMAPEFRPVQREALKLPWLPKHLWAEAALNKRSFITRGLTFVRAVLRQAAQKIYVAWRERRGGRARPIQYLRELTENTDYLKFDECLRMVIDVSPDQKARLLAKLEHHAGLGHIDFGHHVDPHALMTCFIEGPGKHIHFIDAAGGGYALAAQRLKERTRARG